MTNREVLRKFIKLAFNVEIKDSFTISCGDIRCPCSIKCSECPGDEDFWDEEFISDKPMIDDYGRVLNPITNTKPVNFFEDLKKETEETNETTAFTSGEISW